MAVVRRPCSVSVCWVEAELVPYTSPPPTRPPYHGRLKEMTREVLKE